MLPPCRLACGPCQRNVGAPLHGPWADGPWTGPQDVGGRGTVNWQRSWAELKPLGEKAREEAPQSPLPWQGPSSTSWKTVPLGGVGEVASAEPLVVKKGSPWGCYRKWGKRWGRGGGRQRAGDVKEEGRDHSRVSLRAPRRSCSPLCRPAAGAPTSFPPLPGLRHGLQLQPW